MPGLHYVAVKYPKPVENPNLTGGWALASLYKVDARAARWTSTVVAEYASVGEAVAAQRALNAPPPPPPTPAIPAKPAPQRYRPPQKPNDPTMSLNQFIASLIANPSELKKIVDGFEAQGHNFEDILEQAGVELEGSEAAKNANTPNQTQKPPSGL